MLDKVEKEVYLIEAILLLVYCSSSMLILLPLYFKHIGIQEISIGVLTSIFYLSSLVSRPIIGEIVDRGAPKKFLFLGILLFSVSVIFYSFLKKDSVFLYIVRALHGISLSSILLSILLMSVIFSNEKNRASVLGLISVSFLLPNIFMPFLAERIIESYGFGCFFASAFIISAVTLSFLPKIPEINISTKPKKESFFEPLKRNGFIIILLLATLLGFGVSTVNTFTPLWAKYNRVFVGYFFTTASIVAVSIRFFLPGKIKIWGKMKLLLFSFLIFSAGIFLISLSKSTLLLSISGVAYGTGMGFIYPNLLFMAVERTKEESKGKALSVFTASTDLGFTIGPTLSGLFLKYLGYSNMFKFLSIFILIIFFLFKSGWKEGK
ncbi:MAG: MFS transporter [Candidatus Aminicenantia bacterium]